MNEMYRRGFIILILLFDSFSAADKRWPPSVLFPPRRPGSSQLVFRHALARLPVLPACRLDIHRWNRTRAMSDDSFDDPNIEVRRLFLSFALLFFLFPPVHLGGRAFPKSLARPLTRVIEFRNSRPTTVRKRRTLEANQAVAVAASKKAVDRRAAADHSSSTTMTRRRTGAVLLALRKASRRIQIIPVEKRRLSLRRSPSSRRGSTLTILRSFSIAIMILR